MIRLVAQDYELNVYSLNTLYMLGPMLKCPGNVYVTLTSPCRREKIRQAHKFSLSDD